MTDAESALNEYMVQHCYRMLCASKERDTQMHWWERMGHYIALRTPETILQMEREKGLA